MPVQEVGSPDFHKSDPSGDLAHDVALVVAIVAKYRTDLSQALGAIPRIAAALESIAAKQPADLTAITTGIAEILKLLKGRA